MLNIYHQGVKLLEADIPVQQSELTTILTQARRLKSKFSSAEIEKWREFEQTIQTAFDNIRVKYG